MGLVGIGLYTFGEASRLTNIPAREISRWLVGSVGSNKGEKTYYEPLWESELNKEKVRGISFHDLLELRFVKHFREVGVSLQTIRIASTHARELFGSSYPFTSRKFKTDGKTIFCEALEESGEASLLNLKKRQYALEKIVSPSLYASIEFSEDETALRWFPLQNSKKIVIDPQRAFGKPVLTSEGLRTDILFEAYLAEGKDKKKVSRLFDVPVKAVELAIQFEERMVA